MTYRRWVQAAAARDSFAPSLSATAQELHGLNGDHPS
jgi:hypothetical protein